jgi:hypothetical protein
MKMLYMPEVDDRMGGPRSLVFGVASSMVLWAGMWILERILS